MAALWRRGEAPGTHRGRRGPEPGDSADAESHVAFGFTPPAHAQEAWVAAPAGSIRLLEVNPEAPLAVVFVHGLAGRLEHWMPQLAAAGPGMRAIAFDLPGHGGSDAPPTTDVASLSSAIAAVLDGLGLRRALIVGHSLGASAAIEFAASHPGRALGLVLVDPNGDQTRLPEAQRQDLLAAVERDPRAELGWQYRQILHAAQPDVAERILADLDETAEEVLLGYLAASLDHSPIPGLERYQGPVHSLISDLNDLPFSLHRLLPDLPVRYVTGTSHWLMLDRPDDFWELLLDTLDTLRDAGKL